MKHEDTPAARARHEKFLRDGRNLFLERSHAVLHALTCKLCGKRALTLGMLEIVEWTEEEFVDAYWEKMMAEAGLRG
jgi:hypothetical protein